MQPLSGFFFFFFFSFPYITKDGIKSSIQKYLYVKVGSTAEKRDKEEKNYSWHVTPPSMYVRTLIFISHLHCMCRRFENVSSVT